MAHYLVVWKIDVWCDTPREAAEHAFGIMQRPGTTATCFEVHEADHGAEGEVTIIDLEEETEE